MKNTNKKSLSISGLCLILLTILFAFSQAHAQGGSVIVNTLADGDDGFCNEANCTLREAVKYAPAGATITFSVTGTITLAPMLNAFLPIAKDLTITGPGAGLLSVNGNARTRIFRISSGVVSISGLTLTNGRANSFIFNGVTFIRGGAIYQTGGALTLTSCLLSGSSAFPSAASNNNSPGGAIYVENGSLTVVSSTLSGNTATDGGAIATESGSLQVTDSTISANRSLESGGGISLLGANATATVVNSTVSGNVADGQFGGGGGFDNRGSLTITQSTISGNSTDAFRPDAPADGGGGIRNLSGVLNISASTISANSARHGGGIHSRFDTFTLSNSIVAGNFLSTSSPASSPDILGTVSAGDYNLVQNTSTATLSGTHNITGQPALLGALANNGGPTKTHALLTGSPAFNSGDPNFDTIATPYDQRGTGFFRQSGAAVDIGAFEVQLAPTAANVSVSGRVLTSDGRGLTNAIVMMTDMNGIERTARTSAFGYFRFDEIEVAQTYIFNVRSRRYTFAPQVVSIIDNLTELNFTAQLSRFDR